MALARTNRRTVALLIYALLLNLFGQGIALAHRAELAPGAWCGASSGQESNVAAVSLHATFSPQACDWACALVAPVLAPTAIGPIDPAQARVAAPLLPSEARFKRPHEAWYARGPPVPA